jgi:hypothetical protein
MANDNRDHHALEVLSRLKPWLLTAAAALLAYFCARACVHSDWASAQGTYLGIVFLLALAGVSLWQNYHKERDVPPKLAPLYQALGYLLLAFLIGIIAIMIATSGRDRWAESVVAKSAGRGILFAGATFAVGALFGFLFGFPPAPTAQTAGTAQGGQTVQAVSGDPAAPDSTSVFGNTNLREISDWLTKVIVGAGLVDLTRLPPQVRKLAEYMATADPAPHGYPVAPGSPTVALATLGYFSALGVLFGYVWTRFEYLSTLYPPRSDAETVKSKAG